jgi:hypothetical protein
LELAGTWVFFVADGLGFRVKWNMANAVSVEIAESLWDSTLGLCGRLNGDPYDDFLGSDGTTKLTSVSELAAEWKSGATCDGILMS